jgi:hypothetical protein
MRPTSSREMKKIKERERKRRTEKEKDNKVHFDHCTFGSRETEETSETRAGNKEEGKGRKKLYRKSMLLSDHAGGGVPNSRCLQEVVDGVLASCKR